MLPAVVSHTLVCPVHNMLEGACKMFEPVRPADDVGVQCDAHDQRSLFAFVVHDLEGVNNHVGEIGSFALARDDLWNVIELLRVGYRQNAALAGLHPDGLVVMAPVKQIAIAGLLQQIRGERRLRYPGAEPASRALAGMLFDCRGRFLDQGALPIRSVRPDAPN